MILPDNESKLDLLNNEAIAKTIVSLLRSSPDQPVTIGVHGDWGAGKSSILEMIETGYETEKTALCIKFNGWRFQGFEDAKIALLEGIVTGLLEKRPMLTKATASVKRVFKGIDWMKVGKKAGGFAFTALTGIPSPDQIASIVGGLQNMLSDPAKLATKENLESALALVKDISKDDAKSSTTMPEEVAEFRKSFDALLDEAKVDQLVVLVDDLDRCLPDTAIETLEAIRLFVFTTRTAFVIAADEAMIEYAVRKHFPDLPDSSGNQTYAWNYLEKLVQVPLRIPPLGEIETRIYTYLLLAGNALGEDREAFNKLVEAARERLVRPWLSSPLDAAAIKKAIGDKASKISDALTLSDQIGPILASGTNGNPRQIKRFLNALLLRQSTARARGIAADINLPALAKLMLAERFLPRTYDLIASMSANGENGVCPGLADLEMRAPTPTPAEPSEGEPKRKAEKKKDEGSEAVDAQVAEWLAAPTIRAWAQVSIKLGELDLRPYLFVSKDRKDYFGATSALGALGQVVNRLMGNKLAVASMTEELKRLVPAEASEVFEGVRSQIMAAGKFGSEPQGAEGLCALVRAHPELQGSLCDFIDALPVSGLGVWACKGWESALTSDDSKTRFGLTLNKWESNGDPIMKRTAASVLKARSGAR